MEIERNQKSARKLALNLILHSRRGSQPIGMEVPASTTPQKLAETVVDAQGGTNPLDIKTMTDSRGRNLLESQFRNRSLDELGIQDGEMLDLSGDIVQG